MRNLLVLLLYAFAGIYLDMLLSGRQHILEREERSRDCDVISAAVASMKAVAARIDQMKARHEQVVRTQEISSVLHDWHGPDLSTVGHVLLEVAPSSSLS